MPSRVSTTADAMAGCVWYISKYVAAPIGGAHGGRGYSLMGELARLGHKVVVITSDAGHHVTRSGEAREPYVREDRDGIELWRLRTLKYRSQKSLQRVLGWLHFELSLWRMPTRSLPKPDVIVVSSLSLLTVVTGVRLRRKLGCRLIFEVRDIWPLTLVEEGGFSPRNPLLAALALVERLGYRSADLIVGTMPNLAPHVREVAGPTCAVHCIPMGCHPDCPEAALSPASACAIDWPDAVQGKFVIGHVGSIGISNALETVLQCAEQMTDASHIHFVFVGDGDLRAEYQRRYEHLPNVSFLGPVPRDQVPAVLSKCDVLYFATHPSRIWRYGQSLNKIRDYMMAGKPIIGSYSGFPSMVNEAGCGAFVPAADVAALREEVLRWAAMAPADRDCAGQRGREWMLKHRTYTILARQYESLLFP